jgi:hypothetical protein
MQQPKLTKGGLHWTWHCNRDTMKSHKSFFENGGVATIKDEDRTCQTRSTTPTSTTERSTSGTSLCGSSGTTQARPTASTHSRHSSNSSTPLSRTLSGPLPPSLTRAVFIHKSLYLNRTSSIRHAVLKVGHGGVADVGDLWTQWTWGCGGLVDAVGHGRDQGPWDGKEGQGLCCSHIGSKNISFF